MKRIILAALVGVLVGGPAWATDEKGRFSAYGPGLGSCSDYSAKYGRSEIKVTPEGNISATTDITAEFGWILGYASRANEDSLGRADIYEMKSVDLAAWAASWCRDNPSKTLYDAMAALTESRLKSKK